MKIDKTKVHFLNPAEEYGRLSEHKPSVSPARGDGKQVAQINRFVVYRRKNSDSSPDTSKLKRLSTHSVKSSN
jgi:hypothetical protein